ncbi:MAG: 2-hydroxyacyl-CoA dehydratase [Dehalococcoidia bacterium]
MKAIEQMAEAFGRRHDYARDWKAQHGGKVMGYFCTYVPEEILYAAGALPVRVMGIRQPEDVTEPYIQSWWCPHCRSCLADALKGSYDYVDGIVIATTCPHIYQAFNSWKINLAPSFAHKFWMPMNMRNSNASGFVEQQFAKLKSSVEEWLGHPITDDNLGDSIEAYNTNRRLMREIYELRKRDRPPLTGAQALEMTLSSQVMDKREHNQLLTEALGELQDVDGVDPGIRLMILGSENDDVELVRFIESLGATAVTDELCTGSRYFWGESMNGQRPLEAITHWYVDRPTTCPHKDIVERRRLPQIARLAEEYRVQGAIFLLEKFCEPHGYDLPTINSLFQEKGIPFLLLEVDLTTPAGQFRTRIEAFLELIL